MAVRPKYQRKGWALLVGGAIIKAALTLFTRRTWIDGERIPARGGCVVVLNHLSHVDPLIAAHIVWDHGRLPRYLAKDTLWRNKVLGALLRNAQQIPVSRDGAAASGAFDAAVRAVEAGECVVVYPEGTLTRDPGLWPMLGRTGAARIALRTGCPVIPIGQWGAQDLLAPYAKKPNLLPRTRVTLKVGEPVDLSAYADRPLTTTTLVEATETIMTAVTDLVAEIRGEEPPAQRWDPRRQGRPTDGGTPTDDGSGGTNHDTRREGGQR